MDIEYKIISATATQCQMWLNQWKHQYELKIIAMCTDGDLVTILLTREAVGGE